MLLNVARAFLWDESNIGRIIRGGSDDPGAFRISGCVSLPLHSEEKQDCEQGDKRRGERIQLINPIVRAVGAIAYYAATWLFGWLAVKSLFTCDGLRGVCRFGGFFTAMGARRIGTIVSISGRRLIRKQRSENEWNCSQSHHNYKIVPQQYLTSNNYWGTVMHMANMPTKDTQIAVIGALAEGPSIRCTPATVAGATPS